MNGNFRKGALICLTVFVLCGAMFLYHASAQSVDGVPDVLSYQGRLLSSSSTLLGGSGTTYCFRFSLYNASAGGSQVWPSGTPSIMSVTVANGVFDVGVGDTAAGGDALTYNFESTSSVYLNVQVATLVDPTCTGGSEVFETLSPRERVVASGYAINAQYADGFAASTNASGTEIPVIASDTLTLAGVDPEINATGTNTLTLQGGPGTGAIQFFSANNYITSSTLRINGTVSANQLQMAVAPTQSAAFSLVSLGATGIKNGNSSGTFIGINTVGIYNGDYLEFENNSTTVLNVASSGQLSIGTSTNVTGSLLSVATSTNILTVLNNGNIGIGTSTPGNQLTIVANAVPTTDQLSITNAGFPAATAGTNNLQLNYVGGTTGAIESGAEMINVTPGTGAQSTWDGLRITAASTTNSGVTLNAINVNALGSGGPGVERAVFVGAGWDTAFAAAGVPGQSASSSLVQLGNSVSGGNILGTYLTINQATTSPADFLNFQLSSSTIFKVGSSGAVSIGAASSSEGQLTLYNSQTSFGTTIQANTSTARSFTLTLPNSTGTAGQVLITDGSGNLSWDSTGFTKIASSSVSFTIASTSLVGYVSSTFTPANTADQLWVTADIHVSSTQITAAASTTMAIFRGMTGGQGATCNGTQVGSAVTESIPRQAAGIPGVGDLSTNVVDSPGTTATTAYGICVKVDTASDAAVLTGTLTIQEVRQGSDVAETYYAATDTPLTAGDVVSLDPSIQDGVQQSQSPYDSTMLGIVSTQPGIALGNSDTPAGVQELIALAGRVPVHVTNENGDIAAGDYLTSSDIPGVAMRATESGRVVAVAMQSFDPDPSEGTTTGSILGFVDLGWEPGITALATSTASSTFSIGDDLQNFFGVFADAGNAVQTFIRASAIAVENLFVKSIAVLPGGDIKVPSGPDQMSGVGTLTALSSAVFVPNVQVASSSKIFITPTALTTAPLVVISQQPGDGFTVGVATPQPNDVPFDWIMAQSYHVGGSDVSWMVGAPSPPAAIVDPGGGGSGGDTPTASDTPPSDDSSSTVIATDTDGTDPANDTSSISVPPPAETTAPTSTDDTTPADDSGTDASGTIQ
jgi:hypothetical protein